jgi:hypothetical protein
VSIRHKNSNLTQEVQKKVLEREDKKFIESECILEPLKVKQLMRNIMELVS